jgi:tellurite methyltransferase
VHRRLSGERTWSDYYASNADREPREMLFETLDSFRMPGEAVDLGCGAGIDTVAMLERGWRVLATDAEEEAIALLRQRVPSALVPRLRTRVARMEALELPRVDLVWAGFSLFFCRPERFEDVWTRIGRSIVPGGRFAGQILGERDTWASDEDITSFRRADAESLLDGWAVERFDEEENDGEACSGPKHWHVFHVVARASARSAVHEAFPAE